MADHVIRIFLAVSCIVLAIALIDRPRPTPAMTVSDNGIVPPDLLRVIKAEDVILDRPIKELNFDNVELVELIKFFSDVLRIKIEVNWKALEGAGIDRSVPVNIHLHQGTLRQALNWIADSVGGNTTRLANDIKDGAIQFSTMEDLARDTTTEVYNLRPLIGKIQSSTPRALNAAGMTSGEAVEYIDKLLTYTVVSDS